MNDMEQAAQTTRKRQSESEGFLYNCIISPEEYEIFKDATKMLTEVSYSPVAVAFQIYYGMHYSFFCNSIGNYPDASNEAVIINIFKPLEGKSILKEIYIVEK